MAILIGKKTRAIVQGISGKSASACLNEWIPYGTRIVGGVTPGKGGKKINDLPIFDFVEEAVEALEPDASIIFVPAPFAADAIFEAVYSKIPLVICITEGIPLQDMIRIKSVLAAHPGVRFIGPNSPGVISPGKSLLGIMPKNLYLPGSVGIVSRSGTLAYEGAWQTTRMGLGQSTCVGIGGDPIIGLDFIDLLKLFEEDPETKAILLIGEIGQEMEERAALWYKFHGTKPLAVFIAGAFAPENRRMGHAGAMISQGRGIAELKFRAFEHAGAAIAKDPSGMGVAVRLAMEIKR